MNIKGDAAEIPVTICVDIKKIRRRTDKIKHNEERLLLLLSVDKIEKPSTVCLTVSDLRILNRAYALTSVLVTKR